MQELDRTRGRGRQASLVGAALAAVVALAVGGGAALSWPLVSPRPSAAPPPDAGAATPTVSPCPSAAPPVTQTVQAARVYAAAGDAFFQEATLQRNPRELSVEKDVGELLRPQDARALLVVLPLAVASPACLLAASLALDVVAVTGGPAEIGIYPGAATSLVEDRVPASGADDVAAIVDNRPRGVAAVSALGLQEVDVTELARTWSTGGPFPSTGRRIEPGRPLLVVLRPTAADAGTWTVTLGSPPALTVRSTPDCPAP